VRGEAEQDVQNGQHYERVRRHLWLVAVVFGPRSLDRTANKIVTDQLLLLQTALLVCFSFPSFPISLLLPTDVAHVHVHAEGVTQFCCLIFFLLLFSFVRSTRK